MFLKRKEKQKDQIKVMFLIIIILIFLLNLSILFSEQINWDDVTGPEEDGSPTPLNIKQITTNTVGDTGTKATVIADSCYNPLSPSYQDTSTSTCTYYHCKTQMVTYEDGNETKTCITYAGEEGYEQSCHGDASAEWITSITTESNSVEATFKVTAYGKKAVCSGSESCGENVGECSKGEASPSSGTCNDDGTTETTGTITVDTSRLNTGTTINVKINYSSSYNIGGEKWFKNLTVISTIKDPDGDQDKNYLKVMEVKTGFIQDFPETLKNQILARHYTNFSSNSNNITTYIYFGDLEEFEGVLKKIRDTTYDEDICKDRAYFDIHNIYIDQKAPIIVGSSDPLLTNPNSFSFYIDESNKKEVVDPTGASTQPETTLYNIILKKTIKKDANNIYIKHPFIYSLFNKEIKLYFSDFGTKINTLNYSIENCEDCLEEGEEGIITYQKKLANGNYLTAGKLTKYLKINSNQNFSFKINLTDVLNNRRTYNIYFPYFRPSSECEVIYEKEGYTKPEFVNCSVVNPNFNWSTIFWYSIKEESLNPNEKEVTLRWDNNYQLTEGGFIPLSSEGFNKVEDVESGVPFSLQSLGENLFVDAKYEAKEYTLYYYSQDYYDNIESENDFYSFSDNLENLTIKTHAISFKIDLHAPNVTITNVSNIICKDNNEPLTNTLIYLPGQTLSCNKFEFKGVPANISFICKDEAGCKNLSVKIILDSENQQEFVNDSESLVKRIDLSLDQQIINIIVKATDYLNNSRQFEIPFQINNEKPVINYNFNETPDENPQVDYYIFYKDVNITINSTFGGQLEKVAILSVKVNNEEKNNENKNPFSLILSCEEGQKCEYSVNVKAVSEIATTNIKNIKIVIDKKGGKSLIYFNPPYNIYGEYTNKGNDSSNTLEIYSKCITTDENTNFKNNTLIIYKEGVKIKEIKGEENILYLELGEDSSGVKFENYGDTFTIKSICYFNKSGEIIEDISEKHITFDNKGPNIKIYKGDDEIGNTNNPIDIYVINHSVNLNFTFNDELSGFKSAKIVNEYSINTINYPNISKNISFDIPEGTEKEFLINIKALDNLGNINEKILKIKMDKKPPTLTKEIIEKNETTTKIKFLCNDLTKCNITKVICNEQEITNSCEGPDENFKKYLICTCNYDESKKAKFVVKSEDIFHHAIEQVFYDFAQESIKAKSILPFLTNNQIKEIYCAKDSIFPILLHLENFRKDKNEKVVLKNNPLVFLNAPKDIMVKRSSSLDFVFFLKCIKGEHNLELKTEEGLSIINITLKMIPFNLGSYLNS
jgi:hypothetical protein